MSATFSRAGKSNDLRRRGTHRDGFSHPARFERLEQRLALNVAPGTTQFGSESPATGALMEDGLLGVPGAASPTNSTNSANIALVHSTGDQAPTTHVTAPGTFNNQGDAKSDGRSGGYLPAEILAINTAQVANTPYGIRNFEIGSNTGLRHSNTVPMGRGSTVRAVTETRTAMNDLIGNELFGPPASEGDASDFILSRKPGREVTAFSDDLSDLPKDNQSDTAQLAELADRVAIEFTESPVSAPPHLDSAAVDQTMAKIEDGGTKDVVPLCERENTDTAERSSTGDAAHALAASVAVGAVVGAKEPGTRNAFEFRIRRRNDS